jgi:FkbM family methyltransferase
MIRYFRLAKTFKNWRLYLAYKYRHAVSPPLLFETRNGVRVEVPERLLQTFKEIFMDECYMAGMGKKIASDATIIDIGANAGYFTLFAASRFPRAKVLAYEPIPVNYAQLSHHRDLNRTKDIQCFQAAVAGHCGEIQLSLDAADSFTTSASVFSASATASDSLTVACTSLQKLFDDNRIEKCDLLKMDCEGAEYGIFYSCPVDYLKRIDQIAMEVHRGAGENENIDALEAFFKQQGFLTHRRPVGMLWAWRSH